MSVDVSFWDRIADEYAAKPVEDPAAFERKIAVTKAALTQTSAVLDVGCGTGSLALRLAADAGQIYGLDVSKEMIRIAEGKAAAAGVANVTFRCGTLEDADFAPESLDVVCAYSLLHLVDDRGATLRTIYRLLKPGGAFISSTVCLGGSLVPYRLILPLMRWLGKAPRVCVLRQARLRDEIAAAGFVDLQAPDVGAKGDIAFLVARKPAAR
ncbi:MAG: class I SAM-dependent methyltransferase [Myxococcales bacterium]|nr:class I SAM-dependent methyltransferase [Myxococcales bacterium]